MTAPRPALSVVVPVLDEGATLHELLDRLAAALGPLAPWEVVVVDDGSAPADVEAARTAAARHPEVRLVELPRTGGQVAALVEGLRRAGGAVVVTMDGDLQDPPEELPTLLAALGPDVDVVTARRRVRPGPWWRTAGSRAANGLAGRLTGVRLADYGGQLNAYRRPVVDDLLAAWCPPTPLLPLVCSRGWRVAEATVERVPRPTGRSRYAPLALVAIMGDLVVAFGHPGRVVAVATGATAAALSVARSSRCRPVAAAALAAGGAAAAAGAIVGSRWLARSTAGARG